MKPRDKEMIPRAVREQGLVMSKGVMKSAAEFPLGTWARKSWEEGYQEVPGGKPADQESLCPGKLLFTKGGEIKIP